MQMVDELSINFQDSSLKNIIFWEIFITPSHKNDAISQLFTKLQIPK